jgi:hypothetical protein
MSLIASLEPLAKSFTGQLLQPVDTGYDEARRVHNGLIDKRPARLPGACPAAWSMRSSWLAVSLEIAARRRAGVGGRATIVTAMIDLARGRAMSMRRLAWRAGRCALKIQPGDPGHALATTGGVVGTTGIASL